MSRSLGHETGAARNVDLETAPDFLKTSASGWKNTEQLGEHQHTNEGQRVKASRRHLPSRRINPDTLAVQWVVVALVVLLGITSFVVSFRALYDVAAWAGIGEQLQWAVPVFIDGAILTYALAVLVHRSRGESTVPSWISLAAFTAMSVTANAAHALSIQREQPWQAWIGAAVAALAPLGVFAATEQLARLVVERPAVKGRHSRADVTPEAVTSGETPGVSVVAAAPEAESVPETGPERRLEDSAGTAAALGVVAGEKPVSGDAEVGAGNDFRADGSLVAVADAGERASSAADAGLEGGPEIDGSVSPAVSGLADRVPNTRAVASEDPDGFVAWVQELVAEGETVTGAMAGDFLGKSDRTGRNRLNALRGERPEIFEGVR